MSEKTKTNEDIVAAAKALAETIANATDDSLEACSLYDGTYGMDKFMSVRSADVLAAAICGAARWTLRNRAAIKDAPPKCRHVWHTNKGNTRAEQCPVCGATE